MKVIKVISTSIDILNCIAIYTDDSAIFKMVINRFEKKCYSGAYIEKVLRIVRQGECVINQYGAPTFGTLAVTFEAEVIVYRAGEVINGCTVDFKESKSGNIICSTPIAKIMVKPNEMFNSVVKGQIISVVVQSARYNISSSVITVGATHFTFEVPPVYKVGPLSEVPLGTLDNILEKIRDEEERYKKIDPKARDFFNKLLNPHKGSKGDTNSVSDIKKIQGPAYVSRSRQLTLADPVVAIVDAAPGTAVADLPTATVHLLLLTDYYDYLRTIREMTEIYNNEELLKSHVNLWRILTTAGKQ